MSGVAEQGPVVAAWKDPRDQLVREFVAGKSFVDVGGLYGEKVSVAFHADARELAILDIAAGWRPRWAKFRQEMDALGATVECIEADLFTVARRWDVVHSSGVLYHQPNPIAYLEHLRAMATEVVIMTTTICPPELYGTIEGAAVFVPALSEGEKIALSNFLAGYGIKNALNQDTYEPKSYMPNWWFPTAKTAERMCEAAGFNCERVLRWPAEIYPAITLLLRP